MMQVVKLYSNSRFEAKHNEDLGYDLYAVGEHTIEPGDIAKIGVGISVCPPDGFGLFFKERSGNALKGYEVKGGVIDFGYRGEYMVLLKNGSRETIHIKEGDKIAQFVLIQNHNPEVVFVDKLEDTHRGNKGFGSSDQN